MSNYQVSRDGQTFGPYGREALIRYYDEGRILPTDYVLSPGAAEWVAAAELQELAARAAPPPPPPGRARGPDVSDRKILPAVLLCWLLGVFGAHRFYVGKVGTAVLMILTIGGLGIWVVIDLVILIVGGFTDAEGRKITEWT